MILIFADPGDLDRHDAEGSACASAIQGDGAVGASFIQSTRIASAQFAPAMFQDLRQLVLMNLADVLHRALTVHVAPRFAVF